MTVSTTLRVAVCCLALSPVGFVFAGNVSTSQTWLAPQPALVRERVLSWALEQAHANPAQLEQLNHYWDQVSASSPGSVSSDELLASTLHSFEMVHPATAELLPRLTFPAATVLPPDARTLLATTELGSFYQSNLRVWLAKYLVQREMNEEALDVLSQVVPSEVVDPAGFLFYKASCEKALFQKAAGLATLDQLLTQAPAVPDRYRSVAQLMQHELEGVEEESLDEVAQKMSDVGRRLRLARAGQKVQQVEQEVVDLLDELINKIEQSQNQSSDGEGNASNQNQPTQAAQDSVIKGATAPGDVETKKLKTGANWGNLDDKSRAKAKNMISRDFPAHYRQAVEEYFKKLATREPPR